MGTERLAPHSDQPTDGVPGQLPMHFLRKGPCWSKYAKGINRSLETIKDSVRRHKRKVQELQQTEPRAKGCQQRLEHAKAKLRQEEELLEQKLAQPSEEPPKKKQRE